MAFPRASNYQNLPNGVFSATIYSKKVQKAFRKASVVEDISNTDYFGEIANFGDSVRIIKEPEIIISQYARGTQLTPQDMTDEDFSLVIDKAQTFMFKVDDIEEKQSHVNWMDMATDRAGYRMKDAYDTEVLGYAAGFVKNSVTGVWTPNTVTNGTPNNSAAGSDEWLASRKLTRADFVSGGSTSSSVSIGNPDSGTYDTTPLGILNRMNRILNLQNIPQEGRWVVIDPVFEEKLLDERSRLVNNFYNEDMDGEGLENGKIMKQDLRGFRVYRSNNLPAIGNGPGIVAPGGSTTDYGVILAGHDSALATASQISKTESYRDPNSFADIVRGLQLYGRKILRSEALIRCIYNIAN